MRSPADMGTIQIDITNACNKACSNCTRFCGNHKKPFYMDNDTFVRAVDSLDGFEGVKGIMGGEPTLHPEFERFIRYLWQKFGKRKKRNRLIYPQADFIREIRRRECESFVRGRLTDGREFYRASGLGLWSNMSGTYRKYYELIQDTFDVQYLNDHINPSYHQPGLFSRRDLGIPDEEWIPMRDRCWIQNEWSATITPKGAFFCEIAGALDMLFNGPGGWKIEPGWWKRQPEDFADQLHWCEICGFALQTFMRNAEDGEDDVSPVLYEMLKQIDSPRMKAGKTNLVRIENGVIAEECRAKGQHFSEAQPYIEHYEDRFHESNSILFVSEYEVMDIPEGENFGKEMNRVLQNGKEWIVYVTGRNFSEEELTEYMKEHILNPGTLHMGTEYFLFSRRAEALRRLGYDRIAHSKSFSEIADAWDGEKVIRLEDTPEGTMLKKSGIIPGKRYVVWGTGMCGKYLVDAVLASGGKVMFCIDRDAEKAGTSVLDVEICRPEYLKDRLEEFDFLLAGHFTRYNEIAEEAVRLGVGKEKIRYLDEISGRK